MMRRLGLFLVFLGFAGGCANNPVWNPFPATGMFIAEDGKPAKPRTTQNAGAEIRDKP